uniref:Uncharacterized protein n=1 Tax=Anguilla anguilla TaxID=7936 RepID=A0A0E9SRT7_ANGAN
MCTKCRYLLLKITADQDHKDKPNVSYWVMSLVLVNCRQIPDTSFICIHLFCQKERKENVKNW